MNTLRTSPCNLCPRMCGAMRSDGQRGLCGAADELYIARSALHFWEEPPISGEAGSGTVFFSYCPLKCVYCQNAPVAAGKAGLLADAGGLAERCLALQEAGALNINFVTPTHYSVDIMHAVSRARSQGLALPIVWNTSGYERVEAVSALNGTVDVYLADFKYADADLARRYSRAPDYPEVALAALGAMVDAVGAPRFDEVGGVARMTGGVIVRHLVLPGAVDNSLRALEMLWSRFGDTVLYSIMNQYTPTMRPAALARFPELGSPVPGAQYERVLDFADALGMQDYFWQDGPAAQESFIPTWEGSGR